MSEVLDLSFHQVTFGSFELESGFFEFLEDDSQVLQVLLLIFAEYDDIIQVSNSELEESFQDLANESLLNLYLPKGVTKAIFAHDPFPNSM